MKILKSKVNILKIVVLVLLFSLCGEVSYIIAYKNALEPSQAAVVEIEAIGSMIQRISKLELENNQNDELVETVDGLCNDLMAIEIISKVEFENSAEINALVQKMVVDWEDFKEAIVLYRAIGNRDQLFLASEEIYSASNQAVKVINQYVAEADEDLGPLQIVAIGNVIVVLLFLLATILYINKELRKNKGISEEMYLDVSTGLYNRAKCQEIMKGSPVVGEKNRAIIVFDLNDLKKTNDELGHRMGDQLIYDFAQQIKNATQFFENEITACRYGGDEFVVFLDEVEEQDVKAYIDKAYELMDTFNETQNCQYKLSAAVGYGITTEETKSVKERELFDVADANMYQNKIEMKEKKRKALLAQGVEIKEVADDRL